MATNVLRFEFLATDHFSPTADKVNKKLGGLGDKLTRVGKVAAVALGTAAVGGIAAFSVAMVKGVKAATEYQTLQLKTAAVIKSTGNLAHLSVKGIDALAASLESMSGVDETLIINSENVLATFTNIRNGVGKNNDIFNQATANILDLSVAMGEDLQSATVQVGKALNDPIKGITALTRVGVSFTSAQKDQIKKLQESGNLMGAQKIILHELSKEFGGAAKAAGSGFAGSLARVQDALSDAFRDVGTSLLPILTSVTDWFVKSLPGGITIAKRELGKVAGYFTGVGQAVGPGLLDNLKGLWKWVTETAGTIGKAIGPFVKDFASWLKNDFGPALSAAATKLFPAIKDALANIAKTIADHKTDIESFFSALGSTLTRVVIPALETLAEVIGKSLAPVLGPLLSTLGKINSPMVGAVAGIAGFALAWKGVSETITGVREAISGKNGKGGFIGLISSGGAWGIALGVAAGLLGAWLGAGAEAKRKVDDLTESLRIDAGAWGDATRAQVVNRLEQEGVLTAASKLGISLSVVTEAAMGNTSAQLQLNGALGKYNTSQDQANRTGAKAQRPLNDQERAAKLVGDAISGLNSDVLAATQAYNRQNDALRPITESTKGFSVQVKRVPHAWDTIFGVPGLPQTKTATGKYDGIIRKVPHAWDTIFGIPGLSKARAGVQGLRTDISKLTGKELKIALKSAGDLPSRLQIYAQLKNSAAGGPVSGPGGPREDRAGIYALSNGEYVINAAAAGRHRQLLDTINYGRMADGGPVGRRHVNVNGALTGTWPPRGALPGWVGNIESALVKMMSVVGSMQQMATPSVDALIGGNGGNQAIGKAMASAYGWVGNQWLSLRALWNGESGWNNYARNPSSGAFGIPQALPPGKMGAAAVGGSAVAQIAWGLRYIRDAYGSPGAAYTKWLARSPHWYDSGGVLSGRGVFGKNTNADERVLSPRQTQWFERAMAQSVGSGGGGGRSVEIHWHFPNYVGDSDDLIRTLNRAARGGRLDPIMRLAVR